MFRFAVCPLSFLRHPAGICRRGLTGVGVAALMMGAAGAGPVFARPPYADQNVQSRHQIEDVERAEIRRSVGRPADGPPPEANREPRRMSDAERQSLRQAVRDAYGDPRARPRH